MGKTGVLQFMSEFREPDSSRSFFLSLGCLGYLGFLGFHINLKIFCSSTVKNPIGDLIGIALNL